MSEHAVVHGQAVPATETVPVCNLCGGTGTESLVEPALDRLYRLPGEFSFVRCTGCGLARLTPRPTPSQIGFYYPTDYYSYHCREQDVADGEHAPPIEQAGAVGAATPAGPVRGVRAHLRNTVLAWAGYPPTSPVPLVYRLFTPLIVRLLKSRVFFARRGFPIGIPPGRVLDIGCGSGQFLRALRFFGWEVAGVEIDDVAAQTARQTLDGPVFVGDVHDAGFEPASFDFVHMSHVIEHMADPLKSMRSVADLVRPGGLVYIEAPNLDSWNAKRCGAYWFPYEAPRHLHMFSPATLHRMIEEAGLCVERTRTWFFPTLYRWEDTFRQEEARGGLLPAEQRPRMRWHRRPRAGALLARRAMAHVGDRNNGDLVGVWARRPASSVPGQPGR